MRLKTPLPPLVFSFSNLDNLLDGISAVRGTELLLYRMGKSYFLLVTSPLSRRIRVRIRLCEYGAFVGSGFLYRAFLEEHGARPLMEKRA